MIFSIHQRGLVRLNGRLRWRVERLFIFAFLVSPHPVSGPDTAERKLENIEPKLEALTMVQELSDDIINCDRVHGKGKRLAQHESSSSLRSYRSPAFR